MPGPRRRRSPNRLPKPPKHNFPPLTLPEGSNEKWLLEWRDYGFKLISERLAKQTEFDNYCRDNPRPAEEEAS